MVAGRGGSSPPQGGTGNGTSGTRTTTPRPHQGEKVGGPPEGKPEARDGVRRGRAGTAWPPSRPKGPKPAEGAGGILGAGSGQLSPRRRGVPGRIETQKGPIVFEGGRGGGCREKVRAAASGYPRKRRENPPERSSQRPLGCSIQVRAGQTSGSAGSGAKPPVRPPGQVIPFPRGRGREAAAGGQHCPRVGRGGRGDAHRRAGGAEPVSVRGEGDVHPPAGRRGPVSAHREKGEALPEGGGGGSRVLPEARSGGKLRARPLAGGEEGPRLGWGAGATF